MASKVLLTFCSVQLVRACTVGSREDCGSGVCVANSFFDNDPFFNECRCDFCWSGARCDMSVCLFIALPVVLFCGCLCCGLCVFCCVLKSAGKVMKMPRTPPVAPPPAQPVVQAQVVGGPPVVQATVVNDTNAA